MFDFLKKRHDCKSNGKLIATDIAPMTAWIDYKVGILLECHQEEDKLEIWQCGTCEKKWYVDPTFEDYMGRSKEDLWEPIIFGRKR